MMSRYAVAVRNTENKLMKSQGQFFPYFIVTLTSFVTIPVTYSLLKPSKGAHNCQILLFGLC